MEQMNKEISTFGWYHLMRAMEIAKVGNYSISIHYKSGYENGKKDFEKFKNQISDYFSNFVEEDADIMIEITKPDLSYTMNNKWESFDSINKRIETAKSNILPSSEICDVSKSLLRRAYESLNLSMDKTSKIKRLAVTIAQMSNKKNIGVEHMAEAIQYHCIISNSDDYYYNAMTTDYTLTIDDIHLLESIKKEYNIVDKELENLLEKSTCNRI